MNTNLRFIMQFYAGSLRSYIWMNPRLCYDTFHLNSYGVATVSRLRKIIGLFCKKSPIKEPIFWSLLQMSPMTSKMKTVPCCTIKHIIYKNESVMSHMRTASLLLHSQVHELHQQISHVTFEHGQSHVSQSCT